MEGVLWIVLGIVVVCCCFIFPRRYSDIYLEKYGCGISYPVSIILAIATCWYLLEFESDDMMHIVSLIVLIVSCIIMLIRLLLEYKRNDVATKDKILFSVSQILFSIGSFVLIVLLLVFLMGQSNNRKNKRK